ncbi:MAG: hypothetical protein J07HX64_02659 [halophilic archaeon J07HX64]|nr:MAG: hypothetical protein J07HX64_02659 [halophilic archaeon J07HX64]
MTVVLTLLPLETPPCLCGGDSQTGAELSGLTTVFALWSTDTISVTVRRGDVVTRWYLLAVRAVVVVLFVVL